MMRCNVRKPIEARRNPFARVWRSKPRLDRVDCSRAGSKPLQLRGSQDGFTVLEMLTVLSIIGLMSGLILAMVAQFRTIALLDRSLSERAALQKTANHIAYVMEQALFLPLSGEGLENSVYFEGAAQSARFVALARHTNTERRLQEYVVAMQGEPGAAVLVETASPRRARALVAQALQHTLLGNVDSFSLEYHSDAATIGNEAWLQTWRFPGKLPAAVRITISRSVSPTGSIVSATATAVRR
jgi:prepilin-type N-terminal cleavage/methylation domain-containing protein